jgi:His/Glu/Gln/Arg/opine family amino acid ABC transporter permease subunit
MGNFMMDVIKEALPYLLRGTLVTLQIACFSSLFGFIGGTFLGFLHSSKNRFMHIIATLYVTLFRGTPMLIQIPFFYYLLPMLGIELSLFMTAVIAIGLNSTAYISQIIRSGIASVSQGQREAAHVLGFSRWQTMRFIIFPQAIRLVIPALLNEFITLIKDSSLASTIGVVELFKEGTIIISRTYAVIPIYCAVAAIYLILTTLLSCIAVVVERKMNPHAHY